MDRGAWQAIVHGVEKESDKTKRPTHIHHHLNIGDILGLAFLDKLTHILFFILSYNTYYPLAIFFT